MYLAHEIDSKIVTFTKSGKMVLPGSKNEVLLDAFKDMVHKLGGPLQFLRSELPTPELQLMYAKELVTDMLPMDGNASYHLTSNFDSVAVEEHGRIAASVLHPAFLGWNEVCSPKMAPSSTTCLQLATEICSLGFRTGSEPLKLFQPQSLKNSSSEWRFDPSCSDSLEFLSLGYLKGQARCCTMHALLLLMKKNGLNLIRDFPNLYLSFAVVYGTVVACASLSEVALHNAQFSRINGIRKPPNVMSWISMFMLLKKVGGEKPEVLCGRWNDMAVDRADKLAGQKLMAVKNVLGQPDETQAMFMSLVSQYGWEQSPFSDANLASKKLAPGFRPRGLDRVWTGLLIVTNESVIVLAKHLGAMWALRHPASRKPLDPKAMEEYMSMASFVTNTCAAIIDSYPELAEQIQKQLVDDWIAGDSSLDIEIRSLCTERPASFDFKELRVFKEAMKSCSILRAEPNVVVKSEELDVQAGKLVTASLELFLQKVSTDVMMYKNWVVRMNDRIASKEHQAFNWRHQRMVAANKVASEWMETHMTFCTQGSLMRQYLKCKKDIAATVGSAQQNIVSASMYMFSNVHFG